MIHSTGSKSYARACHKKVYIMIITIFFNIYIKIFFVVEIFDYVICFVANNGGHAAYTGQVLHKCPYEKKVVAMSIQQLRRELYVTQLNLAYYLYEFIYA